MIDRLQASGLPVARGASLTSGGSSSVSAPIALASRITAASTENGFEIGA